jgi:hypothetical protein
MATRYGGDHLCLETVRATATLISLKITDINISRPISNLSEIILFGKTMSILASQALTRNKRNDSQGNGHEVCEAENTGSPPYRVANHF